MIISMCMYGQKNIIIKHPISQSIIVHISLEEYNQIKLGMSYSQVVSIIGGKGDAVTEYGDTKIYIWKAESRSGMENVAMTFVNGILKSKMKG